MHPGRHAVDVPQRHAVVMHPGGRRLTYRELEDRSNQLAHWLDDVGAGPDATVAVVAENRVEWAEVLWAVLRSGRWIAPVNWHLKAREVGEVLQGSRASVVITTAQHLATVRSASGPNVPILVMDVEEDAVGEIDYKRALARQPVTPVSDRRCGGRVMFSAGTTGVPKAIRHPGHPGTMDDAPLHLGRYTELFEMDETTVYLSPAPTYHTAPFRFLHAVTQLGGRVVMLDHFTPEAALEAVEQHRVTHAQFVPTMLLRLLRLPQEIRDSYDLSSLRVAITGAASCPPEVKDQITAWWGPVLHELYGASESYGNCHISPEESAVRRGSVGRALTGTIHITDDQRRELGVGQVGRVWFEGTTAFVYEDAEKATAKTRHPAGWTTVGDLGRLDEDGYLYLHGRDDHVIVSGGVNINAQEVEDVLSVHPAVLDVAVVGRPDEDLGQAVTAFVVPRDTSETAESLATALLAHCRERIAHYKCPRAVHVVRELPRAENGKLYKRRLDEVLDLGG